MVRSDLVKVRGDFRVGGGASAPDQVDHFPRRLPAERLHGQEHNLRGDDDLSER